VVPKLTDEVMKKIEEIVQNKPSAVVRYPLQFTSNQQETFGRDL